MLLLFVCSRFHALDEQIIRNHSLIHRDHDLSYEMCWELVKLKSDKLNMLFNVYVYMLYACRSLRVPRLYQSLLDLLL